MKTKIFLVIKKCLIILICEGENPLNLPSCGKATNRLEKLIIGGSRTTVEKIPWQVNSSSFFQFSNKK